MGGTRGGASPACGIVYAQAQACTAQGVCVHGGWVMRQHRAPMAVYPLQAYYSALRSGLHRRKPPDRVVQAQAAMSRHPRGQPGLVGLQDYLSCYFKVG